MLEKGVWCMCVARRAAQERHAERDPLLVRAWYL